MNNDNRNASPFIGRSWQALTLAILATIITLGFLFVSTISAASTLTQLSAGEVVADIPLQPGALNSVISSWGISAEEAGTSFVSVALAKASPEITEPFRVAEIASYALGAIFGLLILVAAVLSLRGRLRWGQLAAVAGVLGAILSLGSFITDRLFSAAASNASSVLESGSSWVEPPFFANSNPSLFLAGLLLIVVALGLRSATRLAKESDGVV